MDYGAECDKKVQELKNVIKDWVADHQFDDSWIERRIKEEGGIHLLNLPHNAKVYDWNGQNVCLNNCLTETTDMNDVRQLIFFPDGSLRYSWVHEGAILL